MINRIKPNVLQLCFKKFGSCVYLIQLNEKNIIIDTSSKDNRPELLNHFKELNFKFEDIHIVLLTHAHWDHTGNLSLFRNAELYDYNNINNFPIKEIKVIKCPGHTKDSLAFFYKDVLFSGDTLFKNGIGRTDFPESVPEKMQESVETLRSLNFKTLCPGHV